MRKTIIQIYEVQKPKEAEALADLGVDHIGSVLTDSDQWKNATIRKTSQVIRQARAKSGLIPLFKDPVKIFRLLIIISRILFIFAKRCLLFREIGRPLCANMTRCFPSK